MESCDFPMRLAIITNSLFGLFWEITDNPK